MPKEGDAIGGRTAASVRMKSVPIRRTTKSTFAHNLVVVVGAGFRCLAYRDNHGKLRNFWNQKVLPLPLHFLEPEF